MKKSDYCKVFPINREGQDVAQIRAFAQATRDCQFTNMNELIDYCLICAEV